MSKRINFNTVVLNAVPTNNMQKVLAEARRLIKASLALEGASQDEAFCSDARAFLEGVL